MLKITHCSIFFQDEFCTYMQLEYTEKEDSYFRSKEVCHPFLKVVPLFYPLCIDCCGWQFTELPEGNFVGSYNSHWFIALDSFQSQSLNFV